MLDNKGYRQILWICNTCRISTTLIFTRPRPSVTLRLFCLSRLNFFQSPVAFPHLDRHIFPSPLFWNTFVPCTILSTKDKVLHSYKTTGINFNYYLWVPVTRSWRVLRLRMEERPPIWRVAENKLNKQSRTADKGWSSTLGGWARR